MTDVEDREPAADDRDPFSELREMDPADLEKAVNLALVAKYQAESDLAEFKAKSEYYAVLYAEERYARYADESASRTFVFNGPVEPHQVHIAYTTLDRWARLDADSDEKQEITFVINSPGGYVSDGLMLYSKLRALSAAGHHVTTVIHGEAASMAGYLFQAGDTRIISSDSFLHLHAPSGSLLFAKSFEFKDEGAFMQKILQKLANAYADGVKRSGKKSPKAPTDNGGSVSVKTADQIREWFERYERWLTPEEALAAGFADVIE